MHKILFFGFCLLSIIFGTIQVKFSNLALSGYKTENKLWIHRGGYPENTKAGITQSLNQGYTGVEVDIYYDSNHNQFLVTNDDPSLNRSSTTLTLEEFLKYFSNSNHHWWFSLKNLSDANFKQVLSKLTSLVESYSLSGRYFIESDQYFPLRDLAKESIPSVYLMNPHSQSSLFFIRKIENKVKILLADFIGVSLDQGSYDDDASAYLSHLSKFMFVVSGEAKDQYLKDPTVQVILTNHTVK